MKTITIYIFAWVGMVVLAIINGLIREKIYGHYMSELAAHQLSTLIAIMLFAVYVYVLTGVFPLQSAKQALMIGGVWLIMTVIFEFIFGHFVAGHSWSRLFMDYNIIKGRVWILVLLWTFIVPYLCHKLRN